MVKEILSRPIIARALITGLAVALCASLLGVTLVLKRYAMIGDGLSHVGFGALSVAMALNFSPLYVSIPVVMLAAFLLLRLSDNSKIKGDAGIALISSTALAAGVIVTALNRGMNLDVYNYMFGSILAINRQDMYLSVILSAAVMLLFVLFYNRIFAVTFDADFAKATGINADAYKLLIALLTAVTVVVGMRITGTLLISSLIIFPALTSMRVFKSFRGVMICSTVVSAVCFLAGFICSYTMELPVGASIVAVNALAFATLSAFGAVAKVS